MISYSVIISVAGYYITWYYWTNGTQSLKSMNPIHKMSIDLRIWYLLKLWYFPCINLNLQISCSYTPEKVSLQNWKPIFPVISRILKIEWHGQTSLKFAYVRFCLLFIKFKKLKNKNKKPSFQLFSLFKSFPIPRG